MNVREFCFDSDYGTFSSWWTARKAVAPHPVVLSRTGIVLEKDGRLQAASFPTLTNMGAALLGWTVVDPDLTQDEQDAALDSLIMCCDAFLEVRGYEMVLFPTEHPALIARYSRHGYTLGDDGLRWLVKPLRRTNG